MSSLFHVPPEAADPFPSEQFVALVDAIIDRMSQTHEAGVSMCSLMDLLINEHKRLSAALIIDVAGESTEEAMFLIRNALHSLCHFAFEAGRQFQIELSDSLGEIDFDHLMDGDNRLLDHEDENNDDK